MVESSGWYFIDATQWVDCPKCKAQIGKHCHTPKGRKTNKPHAERLFNLHNHTDFNINNYSRRIN